MRASWIILVLAGIIPACTFYVLGWTGATESLKYISTTVWEPGHPSSGEVVLLCLTVITWAWAKIFMNVFLLAAVPFAIADAMKVLRSNRRRNAQEPIIPEAS